MKFEFLRANNGDSILICFADEDDINRNILIDGGVGATYENRKKRTIGDLKNTIDAIRDKDEFIDLLIMTHIDDDHIGGILNWFKKDEDANKLIKEVWFNSGGLISQHLQIEPNEDLDIELAEVGDNETSVNQGIKFEEYIEKYCIWSKEIIIAGKELKKFGATFQILSPTEQKLTKLLTEWVKEAPDYETSGTENDYSTSLKDHIKNDIFIEDKSPTNGSSIGFNLQFKGKNFLLLGDAHPQVIVDSLKSFDYSNENPIRAEFVKISHHGSKSNTSQELLKLIDSKNFVISTNGDKHNHPNKQFLARLISVHCGCRIYFNYPEQIESIFSEQDHIDYSFESLPIENEFEF